MPHNTAGLPTLNPVRRARQPQGRPPKAAGRRIGRQQGANVFNSSQALNQFLASVAAATPPPSQMPISQRNLGVPPPPAYLQASQNLGPAHFGQAGTTSWEEMVRNNAAVAARGRTEHVPDTPGIRSAQQALLEVTARIAEEQAKRDAQPEPLNYFTSNPAPQTPMVMGNRLASDPNYRPWQPNIGGVPESRGIGGRLLVGDVDRLENARDQAFQQAAAQQKYDLQEAGGVQAEQTRAINEAEARRLAIREANFARGVDRLSPPRTPSFLDPKTEEGQAFLGARERRATDKAARQENVLRRANPQEYARRDAEARFTRLEADAVAARELESKTRLGVAGAGAIGQAFLGAQGQPSRELIDMLGELRRDTGEGERTLRGRPISEAIADERSRSPGITDAELQDKLGVEFSREELFAAFRAGRPIERTWEQFHEDVGPFGSAAGVMASPFMQDPRKPPADAPQEEWDRWEEAMRQHKEAQRRGMLYNSLVPFGGGLLGPLLETQRQ